MTVTPSSILLVQNSAASATIAGSLTDSIALGDAVLVAVATNTSRTISSIVDAGGNAYSLITQKNANGNNIVLWGCLAISTPVNSATTFTVTLSSSSNDRNLQVVKIVGGLSAQTSAKSGSDSFSGSSGTPSLTSAAGPLDGDLAVALYAGDGNGIVWSQASGWSTILDTGDGSGPPTPIFSYKNLTAAGTFSYAPSFTGGPHSGTNVNELLATFTLAAGPSGSTQGLLPVF